MDASLGTLYFEPDQYESAAEQRAVDAEKATADEESAGARRGVAEAEERRRLGSARQAADGTFAAPGALSAASRAG